MGHSCYGKSGSVYYRFNSRPARDNWVDKGSKREPRKAVHSSQVPFRLKTGRDLPGYELREGPDGTGGAPAPARKPARRPKR